MEQSPQEIHAANRRSLDDFAVYLRMMIDRVLSDMPLVHFNTGRGTFEFAGQKGEICLMKTRSSCSLQTED
jgi:hypothetical protein